MSYSRLLQLADMSFSGASVLVVGAGWMAKQYCTALNALKVKDVFILSRSRNSAEECAGRFSFHPLWGGYENWFPRKERQFDLVIIATPVHVLSSATLAAIESGQTNILIEKPGALYSGELEELLHAAQRTQTRVRIAYNRLTYPSYWKLKELIQQEAGITSCRYTFTELTGGIDFQKEIEQTYQRWGIANSLHVISMAHALIGLPKEMHAHTVGEISWHPSGSRFVGAGVSQTEIPFSYHADWDSAGRWGVEIMTRQNAYRLIPLEKLFRCRRGTFDWEPVDLGVPFPGIKEGVAEELAIMLRPEFEEAIPLVDLEYGAGLLDLAGSMLGYDRSRLD